MKLLRYCLLSLLFIISLFSLGFPAQEKTLAQTDANIVWGSPQIISNSPGKTSVDPFLLSDPTGIVHLFWAEKVGEMEGNQADTVMYTASDGTIWRRPVDLFFSPDSTGTPIVAYPQAVMDDSGRIHLFWLAQPNFPNYTMFYSSANANKAYNPVEWNVERRLADDLTGTKFSFDVKFRAPNELHVFYARVRQGDNPPEERAITYIKSTDLGETWSEPTDINTFINVQHGGSDVRAALDTENRIYSTWTEWDETGNGWRVWFCRSLDNGASWETPIILSERMQNEYERDWAALTILDPGKIVVMWEGGWRAYRHAQYSDDGGATWSKPVDTFPWLIGENGFVEYARDSNGTLYAFISQRMREGISYYGDTDSSALWESVWEGGRSWSQPKLSNGFNPTLNPKVVIFAGNRVMAAWFTSSILEITTMVGTIQNAPRVITKVSYDEVQAVPTESSIESTQIPTELPPVPTETAVVASTNNQEETQQTGLPSLMIIGFAAIGLLFLATLLFLIFRRLRR